MNDPKEDADDSEEITDDDLVFGNDWQQGVNINEPKTGEL